MLIFFHLEILLKNKKNIGHITNENTFMMCPTFLFMIFSNQDFTLLK